MMPLLGSEKILRTPTTAIRAVIESPTLFGATATHGDRKRKRQEEIEEEHVQIVNTVHNLDMQDMHDLFPIFPIRNRKMQKHSHPTTEVLGAIKRNKKDIPIRALIDTGTDCSIVLHEICDKNKSIVTTDTKNMKPWVEFTKLVDAPTLCSLCPSLHNKKLLHGHVMLILYINETNFHMI